jgi:hypothetical protein
MEVHLMYRGREEAGLMPLTVGRCKSFRDISYNCTTATNSRACPEFRSRPQITQARFTFRPSRHVVRASTQAFDINVPQTTYIATTAPFHFLSSSPAAVLPFDNVQPHTPDRERLNKSNYAMFRKLSAADKASRIHRQNTCVKIIYGRKRLCQMKIRGKSNRTHRSLTPFDRIC